MHVGMATGFANHSKIDDARFVREEMAQILLGEELGFDSIWITEHHFSDYSVSPNPLMYLAYLAGKTKRMRLGTQVIVVPWHDPVRLAEHIAVLDHVSGGRAILGFGRGLARIEYEGFRIDQGQARELFDEIVELVMRAMETGFIEGGKIFKQPRREIRPRPLRSLKGRAFCAAGSPPSMAAAARLGLGRLYLNQPMTDDKQRTPFSGEPLKVPGGQPAKDPWLEAWNDAHLNDTPPQPFVSNLVFVDESSERAHELARFSGITYRRAIEHYELTSEHHGTIKGYESYKALVLKPEEIDKAVKNVIDQSVFGTPQEVLEKLEETKRKLNPQGFFPHFHTGGMPHEEAVRNMRFFAKHCLPEMKSWIGAPSTIDGPMERAA
jgi:alkanesulfonate monooxygenase SsuD/methylene tetrahydromethanopterin reductase-like flavin-dependent oxidoreductase (luciferase family)